MFLCVLSHPIFCTHKSDTSKGHLIGNIVCFILNLLFRDKLQLLMLCISEVAVSGACIYFCNGCKNKVTQGRKESSFVLFDSFVWDVLDWSLGHMQVHACSNLHWVLGYLVWSSGCRFPPPGVWTTLKWERINS